MVALVIFRRMKIFVLKLYSLYIYSSLLHLKESKIPLNLVQQMEIKISAFHEAEINCFKT